MDITFQFEEVPAAKRGPRAVNPKEERYARQLRERPGSSARIFEFTGERAGKQATALAASIRKGQRAAFKNGYTASARVIDGKGVVYITYVGDTK